MNSFNEQSNAPCKINTYFIGVKTLLNPQIPQKNKNIEQNKKDLFFPRDFFKHEPSKEKEKKDSKINPRSTFVNLQNEYDEDRELLELLVSINKTKNKNQTMNITKEKNEEKKNNNKIINKNKSISNSKMNNNNLIPFRKLNLNKYNPKSFVQKYRNNSKKNIIPSNKIINTKDSKYLLYNRIIKNKMKKKENIFNFDSIPLSKTKESYLNINYQNPLPNLQPAKNNIIQNFQVQQVQKVQQPQTNQAKGKNTFFNQYASSSVYLPSRKYEQKEKSYLKEYRLGLLSAGSTSYNNVIIPMISLTRQPSGFFNENEKSFGNDNLKRSRKNYMTFRKKNIVSSDCLRQNRKVRNLSSYSKIAGNEEFKDVEKLIPKFHKIKIEKGMMDSNLTKTLKDNFVANYNRSRKYKIRNEFLKLINDKEKIKNV